MSGMDAGPGTDPGAFGFYLTTWVVMMAAMMFPSIAPMVLMYARVQRGRRAAALTRTSAFVSGYLLLWGAAGLVGYVVLKLGRQIDGGFFAWDRAGRWTAAGVLAAAALYELTPAKNVCLRHCRGPLGFMVEQWRDGPLGALRMGLVHGAWCIGCCWALMAALFALGAMSVAWMAFVAALIAVEKLVPWRVMATFGVAAVLVALAIWVAAAPASVPGLTIPSHTSGMDTMMMSH
jgi:predicted metal-binding membrane protein